jgi:hypothetical protein
MYDFKLEWNLDADKSSAAIPATGTDAPVAREPAFGTREKLPSRAVLK